MAAIINLLLKSLGGVLLIIAVVFWLFAIYAHLFGPKDAKKLLSDLKFPLSYVWVNILGVVSTVLYAVIHYLL